MSKKARIMHSLSKSNQVENRSPSSQHPDAGTVWKGRTRGKKLSEEVTRALKSFRHSAAKSNAEFDEGTAEEVPVAKPRSEKVAPTKVVNSGRTRPMLLYISTAKPGFIYRFIYKSQTDHSDIYKCMDCEMVKRKSTKDKKQMTVAFSPTITFKNGFFCCNPDLLHHSCTSVAEGDLIRQRKLKLLNDETSYPGEVLQSEPDPHDPDVDAVVVLDMELSRMEKEMAEEMCNSSSQDEPEPRRTEKTPQSTQTAMAAVTSERKTVEKPMESPGCPTSIRTSAQFPYRIRYQSRKFADVSFEFVRQTRGGRRDPVYQCVDCLRQREAMEQAGQHIPRSAVMSISWRNGMFWANPDDLEHLCLDTPANEEVDVEAMDETEEGNEQRAVCVANNTSTYYPAIQSADPGRRILTYVYESRRHPTILFEFFYVHENRCHQTFACLGCKEYKLNKMRVGEKGPYPSIPTINVLKKNFLSDPDDMDHYCVDEAEWYRQVDRMKEFEEEPPSTSKEDQMPNSTGKKVFIAVPGLSVHGKHPTYTYHSVTQPGLVWQFSFKSLNHSDVTYKCTKCDCLKRHLQKKEPNKKFVIPTIRVRAGCFLRDPDELQHFCVGEQETRKTTEEALVKQIVLKMSHDHSGKFIPRNATEAEERFREELRRAKLEDSDFDFDKALDLFYMTRERTITRRLKRHINSSRVSYINSYVHENDEVDVVSLDDQQEAFSNTPSPKKFRRTKTEPDAQLAANTSVVPSYLHQSKSEPVDAIYSETFDDGLERYYNEFGEEVIVIDSGHDNSVKREVQLVEEEYEVPYAGFIESQYEHATPSAAHHHRQFIQSKYSPRNKFRAIHQIEMIPKMPKPRT